MESNVNMSFASWLGIYSESSADFPVMVKWLVDSMKTFASAVLEHNKSNPEFVLKDDERQYLENLSRNDNPFVPPLTYINDKTESAVSKDAEKFLELSSSVGDYDSLEELLKTNFGRTETGSRSLTIQELPEVVSKRIASYSMAKERVRSGGPQSLQTKEGDIDVKGRGPQGAPAEIERREKLASVQAEYSELVAKAINDSKVCFDKLFKGTKREIDGFNYDSIFSDILQANAYRNLWFAHYFSEYVLKMADTQKDKFEKIVSNLVSAEQKNIDQARSAVERDVAKAMTGKNMEDMSPEEIENFKRELNKERSAIRFRAAHIQGMKPDEEEIRAAKMQAGRRFGKFDISVKNVVANFSKHIDMPGLNPKKMVSVFANEYAKQIMSNDKLMMAMAVRCLFGLLDDAACDMRKEKALCMMPAAFRSEINDKFVYGTRGSNLKLNIDISKLNCNDLPEESFEDTEEFSVTLAKNEKCDTKFLVDGASDAAKRKSLAQMFFRNDWPSNDFGQVVIKNLFGTWIFGSIIATLNPELGITSCADATSVLHGQTFKTGTIKHPETQKKVRGFIRDAEGKFIPHPTGKQYYDPHSWERALDQARNYKLQADVHESTKDIYWHFEIKDLLRELVK